MPAQKAEPFRTEHGQHYSYEMDRVFSEQLELPSAEHNIVYPSEGENKFYKEMLVGNKSLGKGELEAKASAKTEAICSLKRNALGEQTWRI